MQALETPDTSDQGSNQANKEAFFLEGVNDETHQTSMVNKYALEETVIDHILQCCFQVTQHCHLKVMISCRIKPMELQSQTSAMILATGILLPFKCMSVDR